MITGQPETVLGASPKLRWVCATRASAGAPWRKIKPSVAGRFDATADPVSTAEVMAASGHTVCEQARVLFIEGLSRMKTDDERRATLRKLMLELMQATHESPPLEKPFRVAYNELSDDK